MIRVPMFVKSRVVAIVLCVCGLAVVGSGLSVLLPRIAKAQTGTTSDPAINLLGGRSSCFWKPGSGYAGFALPVDVRRWRWNWARAKR